MEIQNKTFPSSWRGYKVDEVRSYLAQIAFEVRELLSEADAVKVTIEEIENRGKITEATLAAKRVKAEEVAAQVIQDATEAAKALREQAEQFFDATRVRAEAEAQMLIENATVRTRTKQLSDPEGFSNTQFADPTKRELELAREKSLEIIEQSKVEGRAMIDQARDLRNEILADLRHKRATLDSEIADLATRRIEAYQSLSRAVQLITEAASIVAVGDVQTDPMPLSSEALVIEARHVDKSPRMPDANEDPSEPGRRSRSGFSSAERSAMKIGSQHIEMGGHLEEGIVRVFTKEGGGLDQKSGKLSSRSADADYEVESSSSVDEEAFGDEPAFSKRPDAGDMEELRSPPEFEEDDENDGQNEELRPSGFQNTVSEEVEDSLSTDSGALDNSDAFEEDLDEEAPSEAASHSDLEEAGEESDAEDQNHSDPGEEPNPELSSNVPSGHEQESLREVQPLGTESQDTAPNSSTNVLRSKRADDILARIRSLRAEEQPPREQAESKTEDHSSVDYKSSPNSNFPEDVNPSSDESATEAAPNDRTSADEREDEGGKNLYVHPAEVDAATQELLEVREEILAPTATMFFRRAKRILADEQNDLLDKVRRNSGSKVVLEEILEEKMQIDSLAISSLDFFEQIRLRVAELFSKSPASSSHKEISPHAVEYSEEFAKELILPLRRRVEEVLAVDSLLEDQSTVSALGVIYRDVRSNRLEALISQYVNSVFCATVMRESGYDSFVWAIDPEDTPCADCLDNSLAGPTSLGEQFPTGHYHPAIHSGCRCLLVPFIA